MRSLVSAYDAATSDVVEGPPFQLNAQAVLLQAEDELAALRAGADYITALRYYGPAHEITFAYELWASIRLAELAKRDKRAAGYITATIERHRDRILAVR